MIKKGILTAILLSTMFMTVSAQLRTGIKAGLSTLYVNSDNITILDSVGIPEYQLGVLKTKVGLHIGFFVQANLGKIFFIQPEMLFNSQTVKYLFTNIQSAHERIKEENYQTLEFPVILGIRLGQLRLGIGPVARLLMNLNSEIDNDVPDDEDFLNDNYTSSFSSYWGWQTGIGLDFWQLHLDVRYESSLDNFGSHMRYYGKPYAFDTKPWRLIFSVGISF